MAEGRRLLSVRRLIPTAGSNPALSASNPFWGRCPLGRRPSRARWSSHVVLGGHVVIRALDVAAPSQLTGPRVRLVFASLLRS